jgi:hypothetical protein
MGWIDDRTFLPVVERLGKHSISPAQENTKIILVIRKCSTLFCFFIPYLIMILIVSSDTPLGIDGAYANIGISLQACNGDINQDGTANTLEIQLCVKVILEIETDPTLVQAADINNDGVVDQTDLDLILTMSFE